MEATCEKTLEQTLKSIAGFRAILSEFSSSQEELNEALEKLYSHWSEQYLNELIQWIDDFSDYLDRRFA